MEKQNYISLLDSIAELYRNNRGSGLRANWETGRRIIESEEGRSYKELFGLNLIVRLSDDLTLKYGKGFSKTNLKNMRKFSRTYEFGQISDQIDWSVYVELMKIEDTAYRNRLLKRTEKENLTNIEVKMAVQQHRLEMNRNADSSGKDFLKLNVVRGSLFTYKLGRGILPSQDSSEILVDCGFNVWRNIKSGMNGPLNDGEIIKTEKKGGEYVIAEKGITDIDRLYTYSAYPERIIDGDTIQAVVDCGFDTVVRKKFRLRGIDTPEMNSTEGERARKFVQARLKRSSRLIIKTYRTDKYDRYLSDIIYMPGDNLSEAILKQGSYLNQELLDSGLALKV